MEKGGGGKKGAKSGFNRKENNGEQQFDVGSAMVGAMR